MSIKVLSLVCQEKMTYVILWMGLYFNCG